MKFGVRKPSFKKSIKARTTGRINRAVKRSVNPLYGKKGVGFVKDPSRSIKNAVYQRTTFSVFGHGGSSKKAAFGAGNIIATVLAIASALMLCPAFPIRKKLNTMPCVAISIALMMIATNL